MKAIPNFPGYFADELGNIYSMKPKNQNTPSPTIPKLKMQTIGKRGYKIVNLRKNGNANLRYVAQIILETFVGPRPKDYYACHGIKGRLDNSLNNLYWATPKRNNSIDRCRDGTLMLSSGENNGRSRLKSEQIPIIRKMLNDHISYSKIGKMFNVSYGAIGKIARKQTWRHIDSL